MNISLIIFAIALLFKIFYFNKNILGINVKIKKTAFFFIVEFILYYHLINAILITINIKSIPLINYVVFFTSVVLSLFGTFNLIKFFINKLISKIKYNQYNLFLKNSIDKKMEEIDKLGNNGLDFEEYIAKIFRSMGLYAKTTTELRKEGKLPLEIQNAPGSGEQGVDVIVYLEKNELFGKEEFNGLLIQCKQYSAPVGNSAVREITGALKLYNKFYNKNFKPVVITNNYFTPSAKVLASPNDVELIDRDRLELLIKEASENLGSIKNKVFN